MTSLLYFRFGRAQVPSDWRGFGLAGVSSVGWLCVPLLPVGPPDACLVPLVVLEVPLPWWLVIVVCWVAAALLPLFFCDA